MTIRKNPRKRNSTSSSSSAGTAASSPQEALWEFGAHLVEALGLADRGDTLSHWIAHYLAELFMAEEAATGEQKARLGETITSTVLTFWKNREHLPRFADPMERYAKAADALRAIHLGAQARSKWDQFLPGEPMPLPLSFYEKSSRLCILGLLALLPEATEDAPEWLVQLLTAKEANFVAALPEAYARLSAERAVDRSRSPAAGEQLRQARTQLLDELEVLLGKLRKKLG